MALLYSNENFPLSVVVALRELKHDVLTIQEAGQANLGISDDEVPVFAAAKQRAVVTLNRKHFINLHYAWSRAQKPHAGIIVCTQDSDFTGQALRIHNIITAENLLTNKLLRVYKMATDQ